MKQFAALVAVICLTSTADAAEVLSTCGQNVTDAVLAANLDCSAVPGFAVIVADGGSLDLAGHTLTTGQGVWGTGGGVRCERDCSIEGHGGSLVSGLPRESDVNWPMGITGVHRRSSVTINGTTVVGYGVGASARDLSISDSTFTGNHNSSGGTNVNVTNSVFTWDNGDGYGYQSVTARKVVVHGSTLTGGGGITAAKAAIYDSSITQMHDSGVAAKLYAENSVIDENCVEPSGEHCADIFATGQKPRLLNSTCSTSARYSRAGDAWSTWGVCALD